MAEKIANTGQTAGPVVVGREDDTHIDPTRASHSIYVTGFPATTKSEDLIIHFQRKKNGGGDIGSITISKPGAAVITFDSPEGKMSIWFYGAIVIDMKSTLSINLMSEQ